MIGGVMLAGRMVACLAGAALAACLVVALILAGGSDEAGGWCWRRCWARGAPRRTLID